MKKTKILVSAAIAAVAAAVPLLANPILSHKYTADPQPIVWNDRLYVYASNDDQSIIESQGYVIQAYTLVSTDDMVNWTDHGEVFRVPRDWARGNASNARAYAPGAAVKNNTVYLYPCGAGGPVGVVTAPRPEGPFNDVLKGAAIADRGSWCRNCNVPWLFDPAAFVDTDGQAYLYFGGGQDDSPNGIKFGSNMRVLRLNDNMISLKDSNAVTINAPRSFEAAYMHKRGSTYYFSYVNNWDGGDGYPSAAIMYMTGTNPMGPFTLRGAVLPNPTLNRTNINRHNNNHAAIIEYKNKWYMFYHDRRVADANKAASVNQRNISVDSLVYNADGTMKEVIVTENGVAQIKNFNPYNVIKATTMNRQSSNPTADGQPGIKADSIAVEGTILTRIANNNWVRLKGVDFGTGASKVTVRAASNNASGCTIEFRTGSATGTLIGTATITSTGSWNTYRDFEANIANAVGVKDFLYLVFKGTGTELLRLSRYQFSGGTTPPLVCSGPAPIPTPNNLVTDGIFDGTALSSSWTLFNDSDGAVASAGVRCNKATISITSVGAQPYQPQLIQHGIRLQQGRAYRLTFKASAAANRTIGVQVERRGGDGIDWGHLYSGAKTFNLTSTEAAHTLDFNMTDPTDENVQLSFNFGGSGSGSTHDVTISDVVLLSTGTTSVLAGQTALAVCPSVSVSGKTLNVSSPGNSEVRVRLIDVRGKVRADFKASGSGSFSLAAIPAGIYIVEARQVKSDTKMVSQIMLR